MRIHREMSQFGFALYTLGRKVCPFCFFPPAGSSVVASEQEIVELGACVVTRTRAALDSTNFFCIQILNLPCQEGKIRQKKNSERIMSPLFLLLLSFWGSAVKMSLLSSSYPQLSWRCQWFSPCEMLRQDRQWRGGQICPLCGWVQHLYPHAWYFSWHLFSHLSLHVSAGIEVSIFFSKGEITSRY